ncbi:MAG: hypothetical protein IJI19_04700, partial [Ruminococcus sp.]|nr:hypothetical protein [Ruminococcus sp.]
MRLYDLLSTIICIIIVILFLLFQRLKPNDFEQVKAGGRLRGFPRRSLRTAEPTVSPFFGVFLRWVAEGSS